MLPKLLMNGIKLESEAPTQEQVAHQQDIPYKKKYRCKFCKMLWLDKFNWLYFSRFGHFFHFFTLKTLPKMEFKTSDNSYKPIKSHWLGNAACQKCVQKVKYGCKICEKDEFGLCWLYFPKSHSFFPLLASKLLANTT